jgi:hypothetical protein
MDDSGAVVASAVTDDMGKYIFTPQTGIPGTGNFTLSVNLPDGFTQNEIEIAHNPGTIPLSRGGLHFDGQNFALFPSGSVDGSGPAATGIFHASGSNPADVSPADQMVAAETSNSPTSSAIAGDRDSQAAEVAASDANFALSLGADIQAVDALSQWLASDPALASIDAYYAHLL